MRMAPFPIVGVFLTVPAAAAGLCPAALLPVYTVCCLGIPGAPAPALSSAALTIRLFPLLALASGFFASLIAYRSMKARQLPHRVYRLAAFALLFLPAAGLPVLFFLALLRL
jgi:hypothetical protein